LDSYTLLLRYIRVEIVTSGTSLEANYSLYLNTFAST
jgi:hypothetical protein